MTSLKSLLQPIQLAFAISLVSFGFSSVQAHPAKSVILESSLSTRNDSPIRLSSAQLNTALVFNAPPPPSDLGEPGSRTGGGRRNPCKVDEKQLKALVPVYKIPNSELALGFTNAEHPTFWFYVPYSGCPLEFVLKDEQDNDIYQTTLTVSDTLPGVISVRLPSTVAPLKIGKRYRWYFSVLNPKKPAEVLDGVDGWVQRESLNLTVQSQLEKATLPQRVALYAANGFWHEALTAASELRRIDANSNDWGALLQAVGLDDVVSEPILECCKSER
ncbi:DUF928 domain-containing protein [Coleofasciculus sp. FACHB-129]|uniref:DUF928 domain-containing protein n=1 Tax=Cyanophyceae TaxID=3028117 RepID=UPI0016855B28|nr:DUF928 domain-containing protein [Coleofasciculus sp. FACHB-129]MBD1893145.1 DUF928 domain-containing protein [Coleofasciculus sp. FACHB-129]